MGRFNAWGIFLLLSCLTAWLNDAEAHVIIGSGGIIEGPPPGPGVAYVPGRWYYGYWIPGQYIIWPNTLGPNQQYIWLGQVYGDSGPPPPGNAGGRHTH